MVKGEWTMLSKNDSTSLKKLENISSQVRKDVVEMIYKAGTGHPAGSLSSVEIFVALYFGIMEEGDKLFVSNGHVCPALYAVMAEKGYFDRKMLTTYSELGSVLQGHPERTKLKGIENTSGPLGLGVAQAVGFAKALKIDEKKDHIFALSSDAEHEEGNHWEAVLLASQFKLDNLTLFVDRNRIQIETMTDQIAPLSSLSDKYRSFGWNTLEINGHNLEEIFDSVENAKSELNKPTVIIANTIAGKGVSFMESDPSWHSKAPNEEEYKQAMDELEIVKQ